MRFPCRRQFEVIYLNYQAMLILLRLVTNSNVYINPEADDLLTASMCLQVCAEQTYIVLLILLEKTSKSILKHVIFFLEYVGEEATVSRSTR